MNIAIVITVLFVCLQEGHGIHNEAIHTSNSACYGSGNPSSLDMTCPAGTVVSIQHIYVGAKHENTGCPAVFDHTDNDTTCCSSASSIFDCVFLFDHTNFDVYHELCNGRNRCHPRMFNSFILTGQCPAGFPVTTTFGYTKYKCLDASNMVRMCGSVSLTTTGDSVYIASDNFPETIRNTITSCSCSVETNDPNSRLDVITIHRLLKGNWTHCSQNLSLVDYGLSTLANWTCTDNTQVETTLNTASNYLMFAFSSDITKNAGSYWFEIRATNPTSTLHVNCPSIYPPIRSSSSASTTTTKTTTVSAVTTRTTMSTTSITTPTALTTASMATSTASSTTSVIPPATSTTIIPMATSTTASTTSVTTPTVSTTTASMTTAQVATVQTDGLHAGYSTSKDNDNLIVIIMSAAAGLLLLVLIIIICICCLKRRSRNKDQSSNEEHKEHTDVSRPTIPEAPVHVHPTVVIKMSQSARSSSSSYLQPVNQFPYETYEYIDFNRHHLAVHT